MSKEIFNCLWVMKPFTEDIHAELYGRKIARELKANQKTVQNKLNLLQEKKILKTRREGKIKYFKLNKENPSTKTALIATEMMKFHELIQENFETKEIIKDMLKETDKPVIVYGSFAKETWSKESDLDLLKIGEKDESLERVKEKFNRKIQVMYLTQKEFKQQLKEKTHYIKEILENHVICQGFEKITEQRFEYE